MGYQENVFPEISLSLGHDVRIIASTETMVNGKIAYTSAGEYKTPSGIPVQRLPYAGFVPKKLAPRVRINRGYMKALEDYSPDIIYFHGASGYEIYTAARYAKKHPKTLLVVDSHAAYYNSARNFLSKYLLHMTYYRLWYRLSRKYIDKLYYIGLQEKVFLQEVYGVKESEMSLLPLGGDVMPAKQHDIDRAYVNDLLGLTENNILLVQSARHRKGKRTIELFEAFYNVKNDNLRIVTLGGVDDEMADDFNRCCERDDRIIYLGWKSFEELKVFASAADLYVQPGSCSASLQLALCCGTPALVYPYDYYVGIFGTGNGVSYAGTVEEFEQKLQELTGDIKGLRDSRAITRRFALELLDYRKQIGKIVDEYNKKQERLAKRR